ncbi:MAG: S9 family peptidase [Acidobacteria bacterium]|nr:S9 family peptidase [Acidobacteriota bacterium]
MTEKQIAAYGSWLSPISSELVVSGTLRVKTPVYDDGNLYWNELRPNEGGRNVIVKMLSTGETLDITLSPFNARTRVHEYGGGEFLVANSIVYFSNFSDQRIYKIDTNTLDLSPKAITNEGSFYYADYAFDKERNRLISIREDHTNNNQEAINSIVAIDITQENTGVVLVSGNDFYSSPRISPDGTKLSWLTWHHPNMPWDSTELWIGEFDSNGLIKNSKQVAGGKNISIFQPEWSSDGILYFISDQNGWWNLYSLEQDKITSLYEKTVDFGLPQWVFGMRTYDFMSDKEIICSYTEKGVFYLASLDVKTKTLKNLDTSYTEISDIRVAKGKAFFVGGSPTKLREIVQLDLSSYEYKALRQTSGLNIDTEYLSIPETIEFPTENNLMAYAFYYPPKNRDYYASSNEYPPLLVKSHGGPTAATSSVLSLTIQYWTSRGFAVLDVNYGGSAGYGRAYRERLNNNWGIVDVDDCVNGAKYLVSQNKADKNRLAIDGGSAGGYTTLCVLTFRDYFQAGASYYGVSDLNALAEDTHKFESRYLDNLIGPYPKRKDLYDERSPINHVEGLSCPVILFQGLEDKVVPPNQAEKMLEALRSKKIPVAYVPFEGEQHGFRRAENIKRSLEAEFYFYSQIFKFPIVDKIEPVEIENLNS